MSTNPYSELSPESFWRSAVVQANCASLASIYKPKWKLRKDAKIATAGSCFAQHITKRLKAQQFNVLDVELAPMGLPPDQHNKFGFSMYSARYGNIYTARQLCQLAEEVAGLFTPEDLVWEKDGYYYDSQRPAVEPEGLSSGEEVIEHRKYHLHRVKNMFETMDVFIFTLGLTEGWMHHSSGTVYPVAPGVVAGSFDANQHSFHNFNSREIRQSILRFCQIVRSLRKESKAFKMLLTVSPVPLTASASGNHILLANTYSKSCLRAVAQELRDEKSFIDYFPSYEIITNPAARSSFYQENLRSVRQEAVDLVMDHFFSGLSIPISTDEVVVQPTLPNAARLPESTDSEDENIQCEEALLEAFAFQK